MREITEGATQTRRAISLAYLMPASILFIPLASEVFVLPLACS